MITAIREVRRAKNMTLEEVAKACVPPTTAQTIGRLETGTRTVSVGWLNRIAAALGVTAADLVSLPDRADLPVAAILGAEGAVAPKRAAVLAPPPITPGLVAVTVTAGIGEYRTGDQIWCERLAPDAFAQALHRDVLVPQPAGRFLFGRLLSVEGATLTVLPPAAGARPVAVEGAPWLAQAVRLLREF